MKKLFSMIIALFFSISLFSSCSQQVENQSISNFKTITTQELKDNLNNSNYIIVDTRINDAFNGWKLDGIERGGHIKGATDFSSYWLDVDIKDKEAKLLEIAKNKGITPDKNVVLYDANGKDALKVAEFLSKNGFKNIYIYDVKQWAKDKNLPMESYKNYYMLVPAKWVKDLIDGKKPETYKGGPFKIFEVSWGEESKDHNEGHIPGAVHINTDEVEEGPMWNRLSDDRLEKFALRNGITTDTTVVLYGTDSMAAFRVAVILKYMGVKDVRVLNGGLQAWKREGYELETKKNQKTPVKSFGAKIPVNKDYIIDLPEAKEILKDKEGSCLVDIRSWDEYIGKTSGYDYIKGKGRPQGAVWGHAGTDPNNLQDFRNIDNTMRNAKEILEFWKEWGITPDKRLAFYCGTGWRAAEVLWYADVMGLERICLYDGGWNEWCNTKGLPIEVGEPKR
ncbi:thiosulfate/3-mercaptopyruvate sulfurtransferase [Caloramator fervidus]|uniref:Thiosulfate/3-mercaptopyruvate sulfurtransferase n=1 Tax=Caloramator fervidus TaxID=29344 RepID=A0A1H5VJP8_9CLOT|nr:sulfurtransferase [Caloramator fervidus]SEF87051.1 thiosulfate/3-mercaptopyruvate sulfurtransferase [Caloramator fervidus]